MINHACHNDITIVVAPTIYTVQGTNAGGSKLSGSVIGGGAPGSLSLLYIGQGYLTKLVLHYLGHTLGKEVPYSVGDGAIVSESAGSSLLSDCLVLQAPCPVLPTLPIEAGWWLR